MVSPRKKVGTRLHIALPGRFNNHVHQLRIRGLAAVLVVLPVKINWFGCAYQHLPRQPKIMPPRSETASAKTDPKNIHKLTLWPECRKLP